MKIEMGESLVYSYLRQVKNCVITQTNWRNSNNWQYSQSACTSAQELFETIKQDSDFASIFPSNFDQTIKQAEIDAVGINDDTVFAVEIAYHEAGLNYGSKDETKERIVKKLLRTLLLLNLYFPQHKHIIMFCSPKVNNATELLITELLINEAFGKMTEKYAGEKNEFLYVSNNTFYTSILQPILEKTENEADSSELFARSVKLLNLFDIPRLSLPSHTQVDTQLSPVKSNTTVKLSKSDAVAMINTRLLLALNGSNAIFSNANETNAGLVV